MVTWFFLLAGITYELIDFLISHDIYLMLHGSMKAGPLSAYIQVILCFLCARGLEI